MILFSKILNAESTNTPLLIFHGLFGMLDNWQTLAIKFAKTRPVHIIDLRNHGRSFHSEEMNLEVMAEDVLKYVKYHSLKKIILLGHSLGGKVVMKASFSLEEKIEKLIVVDIGVKQYTPHHQSIIKALESIDFNNITKRNDADLVLKNYIEDNGIRQFLLKNVYKNKANEYNFRFNLPVISKNYLNLLSEIKSDVGVYCPTLFVKGENSFYIQEEDLPSIKKIFSIYTLKVIGNSGHWVHAENPYEFYNTIEDSIKLI